MPDLSRWQRKMKKIIFPAAGRSSAFAFYSQEPQSRESVQERKRRHFCPVLFTGSFDWEIWIIKASVLYLAYFFLYGCAM